MLFGILTFTYRQVNKIDWGKYEKKLVTYCKQKYKYNSNSSHIENVYYLF